MRMYTNAQDGTVMCSIRPAHLTWVLCFAPEIALAMESRPDDSPGLPYVCVRVNISATFLAEGHTDEPMSLPIRFFSRLLHQENGLSAAEKMLTNEIELFLKTLHGNVTAQVSFHLNTSSPMHMIAAELTLVICKGLLALWA